MQDRSDYEAHFHGGPRHGQVLMIDDPSPEISMGEGDDYNTRGEVVGPEETYVLERVEGSRCYYRYDPGAGGVGKIVSGSP